jgi:hypothetical protein
VVVQTNWYCQLYIRQWTGCTACYNRIWNGSFWVIIIQTGQHTRHAKRPLECEWKDPDTISCKTMTPDTFPYIL